MNKENKNVVLILGKPRSGKTTSLRNLTNQERIAYLNTDMKSLPFPSKMQDKYIDDPESIIQGIEYIEESPDIDRAVLDTITFLMDMYEQQYVNTSPNTQKAWGNYASFYKTIMNKIKSGTKDYCIMAHVSDVLNESEMLLEQKAVVKGSVGRTGIEADFSVIVATKVIPVAEAEKWENDLLTITEEDREDGIVHVFQTRIDKNSLGEKMRSPLGLFSRKEKFINNDIDLVFNRLHEYYS